MKKGFVLFVLFSSVFLLRGGEALRICDYPDGKKAMLALTFDDMLEDQCRFAPAILKKYNLKATFFMIPGRLGDGRKRRITYAMLKDVLPLVEAGHEIGNHSLNHSSVRAHLERKDYEALNRIVVGGQDRIEELTGVRPHSFCYPGNRRSPETDQWVLQSHLVTTTRSRRFPKTPDKVRTHLRKMIADRAFGDTMIHGIIEGYDPYASVEEFEACIAELVKFRDEIAIGTMLETGCYERRAAGTKLTVLEQTPEKSVFLLELEPQSRQYAGFLSLALPDAASCRIRINGSEEPVAPAMQGSTGIFRVRTGDLVTIEKLPR